MARMIPPAFAPKTPAGEKELFTKLRDDPGTNGWVVLHSLDIKKHQTKIEGELDAVLLVPGLGVLCIEVKGCDVARQDGKWIYPYETSVEGPFKQASKAMHSLREYVSKKDSSLGNLLFFSAVVFTRVNFEEQSPEWHPWQYINRRLFLRQPVSESVVNILNRAHAHVKSRVGHYSWYIDAESRPTAGQLQKIIKLLRDDFEYSVSIRNNLERLEQTISHFTEEQFTSLDLLQDNDRIVFKGPAGTGKTFLALEAARRSTLEGKRVLVLCYNSLLGDWLKSQAILFSTNADLLECKTFHSLLIAITGEKPQSGAGREYWRRELPIRACDRLLDESRAWPEYDFLVVDEAQDLLEEEYLDVLDVLLKGGLAGGKWAFFGDFERQAIYVSEMGKGGQKGLDGLLCRAPHHVNFGLRINCRNAEPIAQTLAITSGLSPGYKRILHDHEGSDVDPLFYSSKLDQRNLLGTAITSLLGIFKPGEIVVLSMRNDEESCAGSSPEGDFGNSIAPIRMIQNSQTIAYSSIHTFKGLEAPAVILTDIETLEDERTIALLYIGMSRARVRLYMLMHESCRKGYNRILDAGLEKTSRG